MLAVVYHFTCCLYGSDRCRGSTCDHGNVGLCGHRWRLIPEQAVLSTNANVVNNGNNYDEYDSDGDY